MTRSGDVTNAEWLLSEVEGYKYVSFDVYDTLLVRPYVRPHDLFRHIESAYDSPGFAEARIQAESDSRGTYGGETTFDRIYETIPEQYRHLKDVELEFESRVFCPPDIRDCFNEICKSHRVILISDMYLPKAFIQGLLEKCGLRGYDDLYVSCEYKFSKGSGVLFRRVLFDYRIWAKELIHIGDNIMSDYHIPRGIGIYAAHVSRPIDRYLRKHPLIWKYYRYDPSFERSMLVSLDMIRSFECTDDFWYDVSYRFGGPLALDYVNFIHDHRRERDTLFFVARDGYNLKAISDRLYPDDDSVYIHAPRILNILIGSQYRRYKRYQEVLVKYFYPDFKGDPYGFFLEKEDEIERKRKELFESYASTLGDHKDICLVDVTTMKYSSQKLIRDLYPESSILGLYYFVLNVEPDMPHHGYHVRDRIVKLGDNINVTEFFLTSPEPPVEGIGPDGRPKFKDVCDDERRRLDIYGSVTQGEVDYSVWMQSIFGEDMPRFGYENIRDWMKVLTSPLCFRNRSYLAEMKWPVDASHDRYVSMVYHPRDTWYHLRKTVLDAMWYVSKRLKE